jgi:low affinity Fe/Cu permease
MIVSAASFTGGHSSAILLGGLYLNWCDDKVLTTSLSVLILIVIYSYFLQNLVIEFGVAIQSIFHGKATLDKVMVSRKLS